MVAVAPLLALVALDGWLEVRDRTGADCLAADRLEAAVAHHLGHPPFGPNAGTRARAEVRRSGEGFTAHLQLQTAEGAASGRREIAARSSRCRELESALAVSLVLALDRSHSVADQRDAASASAEASGLVSPLDPDQRSEPNAGVKPEPGVREARHTLSWGAWVGAGGVAGALPGFAFGPTVGGRAARNGFALDAELGFEWGLPVNRLGSQVRSWRAIGMLLPCVRRLESVELCAGVRGGLLHATALRSSWSASVDLTGRLVGELFGGAVSIYAEPGVALVRTRLKMAGMPAWTAPGFSAAAGFFVPLL